MLKRSWTFLSLVAVHSAILCPEGLAQSPDCSQSPPLTQIDGGTIQAALTNQGLVGFVHGFSSDLQTVRTALLTVRSEANFFESLTLTLVPENETVAKFLGGLGRHDKICLHGDIGPFGDNQIHALIQGASLLQKHTPDYPNLPPYVYKGPELTNLPQSGQLSARVHAVTSGVVVLEVVDRIVPLIVKDPSLIPPDLFRFDLVQVSYTRISSPNRPTHLELNEAVAQPLRVTRHVSELNGQRITLRGSLSLFPRSPQIQRDVFALSVNEYGSETQYTLVNFENPELFAQIQERLAQLWASRVATVKRGRNNYVNESIVLLVEGVANIQSPNQANPQFIIDSLASIRIQDRSILGE